MKDENGVFAVNFARNVIEKWILKNERLLTKKIT